MIYILTGEIRSGKTTTLLNWSKSRNDVDGLLCPDDINGKRYFLNIYSKDTFPLSALDDTIEEEIIPIGSFKFLKSAFQKANDFLTSLIVMPTTTYIVIDELGKLELKNLGLHDAAKRLIPGFMNKKDQHLIIVIRSTLLDEMIKHYKISDYTLLMKKELSHLK